MHSSTVARLPGGTRASIALSSGGRSDWSYLQPHVAEAATVGSGDCNRMCQRLQPYVPEAATIYARGCNRMWQRLQPYVAEAATVRGRGCNRM